MLSYRRGSRLVCSLSLICKAANCQIDQIRVMFLSRLFFCVKEWKRSDLEMFYCKNFLALLQIRSWRGTVTPLLHWGFLSRFRRRNDHALVWEPRFLCSGKLWGQLNDSSDGTKSQCHRGKIHRNFTGGWKKSVSMPFIFSESSPHFWNSMQEFQESIYSWSTSIYVLSGIDSWSPSLIQSRNNWHCFSFSEEGTSPDPVPGSTSHGLPPQPPNNVQFLHTSSSDHFCVLP